MYLYFKINENFERLKTVLAGWENVPWQHMGESKSGVDCSKLLAEVLLELGIISSKIPRLYIPPDWMIQSKEERLLQFVDLTLNNHLNKGFIFDDIFYDHKMPLEPGDFLFFSLLPNGVTHHAGIYLGEGKIFHCLTKKKCSYWKLTRAWEKRITFIYRLIVWQ